MYFARISLAVVGLVSFVGVGKLTAPAPASAAASSVEQCVAFCRKCDSCYASDERANASCRFLMHQGDSGQSDCEADCAAGAKPKAAVQGGFGEDWHRLTCEQLSNTL